MVANRNVRPGLLSVCNVIAPKVNDGETDGCCRSVYYNIPSTILTDPTAVVVYRGNSSGSQSVRRRSLQRSERLVSPSRVGLASLEGSSVCALTRDVNLHQSVTV